MMRIVEQKTYRAAFSSEDKEKFEEVIEFLDDLRNETLPYLFEFVYDGDIVELGCYEISKMIALLRALEKNDFKVITYE